VTPSGLVEGGAGATPGAAAGTECEPGFIATLPQEYNDQWGKMVVLQVFCAQAAQAQGQGVPSDFIPAPQQADAFASTEDPNAQSAISGSMGPMGTRPISAVEAEEMGGGSRGESGGFSGMGW